MNYDEEIKCDVLVIGSGMSGICSAIQAGRCGCRTVLLEKDEVLGGNSGPNLGVEVRGAQHYNLYGQETGLIHELENEEAYAAASTPVCGMLYNISRRREAVMQEFLTAAGVTVLKSHYARKPLMDGDRIDAVLVEDTASFRTILIRPTIVIDSSGDGQIGYLAGADFTVAPEAKSAYGERSAPESPVNMIQGTSMTAIAVKTGRDVPFVAPADTPPYSPRTWEDRLSFYYSDIRGEQRGFSSTGVFRDDAPEGTLCFLYFTEAGGDKDTVREAGLIYEMLLTQVWSFWNHVKNGPHAAEAARWDLLWVSPKAGKRQSRRLLGDHILTQSDVEDGRTFPDDIAYGGHNLDEHRSSGTECSIYSHSVPPMYGIPFRCAYSRNIANLMMGGRLISATHLAHSSSRVMRTGGAIGQSLGIAAAMCVRHKCTPRELLQRYSEEFRQELWRHDASVPPLNQLDPGDLAAAAVVHADSETRFNDQVPLTAVPLFSPAGAMMYDWPQKPERIEVFVENTSAAPISAVLRIFRYEPERRWLLRHEFDVWGRDLPNARLFHKVEEIPFTVQPGFQDWLSLELPDSLHLEAKRRFHAEERMLFALYSDDMKLKWHMAERPNEICRAVEYDAHRDAWMSFSATPCFRIYPETPFGEAANVINGFTRRYGPAPADLWIAPFAGEPVFLNFNWEEVQSIGRAVFYFDNLEPTPDENPWRCRKRVSEKLVKTYALEVELDGEWVELFRVEGNRRRRREHRFPAVTTRKLRLRIDEVYGSEVRVYQVNLYH